MQSNIRWSRSDYLTLGKAVSNFNKKIRELQTEENKLYLPEPVEYGQIKKEILTRGKLNDVLRSLRSFNEVSVQPILNRQTGQMITQWEMQETEIKSFRAEKNLIKQSQTISGILEEAKTSGKRISSKQQQEMKLQYLEVLESLRDIKAYREKAELPYMTYKKMVTKLGDVDYEMIKATIYRQNFEYAVESFKEFRGYELFKDKLDRLKNPMYFYNYTRRAEYFKDIFVHYREGEGVVAGTENTDQEKFNEALEQMGLIKEEKNKLIRKYTKEGNEEMLKRVNSIEAAEDLFDFLGI